jgi:hypothetical protein
MKEDLISEQNRLKKALENAQSSPIREETIACTHLLREPELHEQEEALISELSYRAEKLASSYNEHVPHILRNKDYEIASEKMGKEINLADAGQCFFD